MGRSACRRGARGRAGPGGPAPERPHKLGRLQPAEDQAKDVAGARALR